ncbi:FAD/NAD(P)-binding domain-containing protein [Marasmius fiardii PR-910]|nr:FAD/NAD(P)-binding domain-containing protein [Marasmius fiardii PR-910]
MTRAWAHLGIFSLLLVLTPVALGGGGQLVTRDSPSNDTTTYPVCIIGAGPTGLSAAHALEDKKYTVIVFEREQEVGGKCQSYYTSSDHTTFHAMGPILISNQTYTESLPIVEAAGVPFYISKSVTSGYNYPPLGQLPTKSVVNLTKTPEPSDEQKEVLVEEIGRYNTFWETEFRPSYSQMRYPNGVPKEFSVPMSQWLASNGYQVLPIVARQAMALAGYDDLNRTATIYGLQFLTPDQLAYFANVGIVNFVDFHAVMVHYASSVKGKILKSTTVTKVDRSKDRPIVSYVTSNSGKIHTQTCSHIINAFPPLLEALTGPKDISQPTNNSGIGIDLSDSELAVFSKVGMTVYLSSAVSMPNVPVNTTYSQLPTQDIGQPILATKSFADSPILTTYSWGGWKAYGRNEVSLGEARKVMLDTFNAIDFSAAAGVSGPIRAGAKEEDVREFRQWDYFPRFQPEDLADGIYERYNAVQGYKKTYWASGLNGFELVEHAVRAGKEIVATFF